jgi:hypothetical protein
MPLGKKIGEEFSGEESSGEELSGKESFSEESSANRLGLFFRLGSHGPTCDCKFKI